jgi:hypothetical protein
MYKPVVPYVLSDKDFRDFAQTQEALKTPSSYSSAFTKYIRTKKFGYPEISQLPCAHAAIIATSSTELACTRAENGSDADVQGVQENLHEGV